MVDAGGFSVSQTIRLLLVVTTVCCCRSVTAYCFNDRWYDWFKDRLKVEHCGKEWIRNDLTGLENDLETKLFGQHLATKTIAAVLRGHLEDRNPPKALSLSLHGYTGVGKTFVSEIIASRLYKNGMKSKFVQRFYGETDFPYASQTDRYKQHINDRISECGRKCCQCLFIFDEIDKMPPGIFDAIKAYFDHYSNVHGVDYRNSIFLFISNIGAKQVFDKLVTHWRSGKQREELRLNDIEPLMREAVFNTDGGLKYSALIKHNLLGTFIPFLPLERKHIKQCIIDSYPRIGFARDYEKILEDIANDLPYSPDDTKLFARTGCTGIRNVIYKHWRHDEF